MGLFSPIKNFIKYILTPPVTWIADKYSSAPVRERVHDSLTELYRSITQEPGKKGLLIDFKPDQHPVVIFSDHHKGARNGSDDFTLAESNYLAALEYYNRKNFYYINLGDSEELWENNIFQILKHNKDTFEKEKLFVDRSAYYKVYGNHDLYWSNDPFASLALTKMYDKDIKIHTGIVLRVCLPDRSFDILCTHGHQGDAQSDGNAFSKWFVSNIWGPLQAFLDINTNTPSSNQNLKSLHNQLMYEWSAAQKETVLITGHTHQPVFNSLTHLERLYLDMEHAVAENNQDAIAKIGKEIPKRKKEYDFVNSSFRKMIPSYFNTGCCCYHDGTITGIEIADGYIRLVKWDNDAGYPVRHVAEEESLLTLARRITGY